MSIRQKIEEGISHLDLSVNDQQLDQFVEVIERLVKWNKHFNLTAIRDVNEMIKLHLLDSLTIIPYLKYGHLLDIGTGPGFPGIPLAIYDSNRSVSLLDSNGKKTRYLNQLTYEMTLKNVTVLDTRVEEWQPEQRFSVIVSRAFASLGKMVDWSRHLMSEDGVWQAMKGEDPVDEIAALPNDIEVCNKQKLCIPGVEAQRHLITLRIKN